MQIVLRTLKTLILITLSILSYSCKENNKSKSLKNNENLLHIKSKEGEQWNVLGVKIVGKILSTQTNNKYSVIISETPPNQGPPLHVHKNEDELFYILKGNYLFHFGNKKIKAKQGDFIKLPRGIPHRFVNTDTAVGITMNTITPGGFENFFNEISKESEADKLTKYKIDSIANQYGVSFVKK